MPDFEVLKDKEIDKYLIEDNNESAKKLFEEAKIRYNHVFGLTAFLKSISSINSKEFGEIYSKLTNDYFFNVNNKGNDFMGKGNQFYFIPYELIDFGISGDTSTEWLKKYSFIFNAILDKPYKLNYHEELYDKCHQIENVCTSFLKISKCSAEDFIIKKSIFNNNFLIFSSGFQSRKSDLELDIIGELARLGYSKEIIPRLCSKIADNYYSLEEFLAGKNYRTNKKNKMLSASFIFTCRGEYQCPVNMKAHYNNSKNILINGRDFNSKISFTEPKLIKNYMLKTFKKINISKELKKKALALYDNINSKKYASNPQATAAGIIYITCFRNKVKMSLKEIAGLIGTNECTARKYVKKIANER